MFNLIKNDKKLRTLVAKYELYFRTVKILNSNQELSLQIRSFWWHLYLFTLKKYFKTKIKNHCVITGHTFSLRRRFRISRMPFKKLVMFGILPGIKRSSW